MDQVIFPIEVSHGQLAVFQSALSRPFNAWTTKHVQQGFAWQPKSASFVTLVESGTHLIEVVVSDRENSLSEDALRVIEVPFENIEGVEIEVGSISDSRAINLPVGRFTLRCQFFPILFRPVRVRLDFYRNPNAEFRIVRADPDLFVDGDLLITASTA